MTAIETLQRRENELVKSLASGNNKEKETSEKELNQLRTRIQNLSAFENLKELDYVTKGTDLKLGRITQKTPGHQPTVFVSWGETVPVPEQPKNLILDEIANSGIIKSGDIVRVGEKQDGQITGYRLDMVYELEGHGWIEVSNSEIIPSSHWQILDEEFDRWDFDRLVGSEWESVTGIASLARANTSTIALALEWVRQKQALSDEDKGKIKVLEKRLREIESIPESLPPLEYLRELSIAIKPPIAATKVNAPAVKKLLCMIEAAATCQEWEVAQFLIAEAHEYAMSQRLRLDPNKDWAISPRCETTEEAIALCPSVGDRVMSANGKIGSVKDLSVTTLDDEVEVTLSVAWDDQSATEESGYFLEILLPLLEYLSSQQPVDPAPVSDTQTLPPLLLGIQEIEVSQLRSHPINVEIYGETEDDTVLEEMIETSGWIKTLIVTPEREVVGGNRRLRIAKKRGMETITIEVRDFASKEAVLEALLLDNAVREKTPEQKVREARFWLPIESAKAKARKGSHQKQENFPGSVDKGQVRDIVAARVGLGSGKTFQKADKVLSVIDSLVESEVSTSDSLRQLLNTKSIHAAYTVICNSEEMTRWKPLIGDKVIISLKAERHPGVSGTIATEGASTLVVRFDQMSEGMSEDSIYLSLLLPADPAAIAARAAKKKKAKAHRKPEETVGLKEQKEGGLIAEKDRNEGDEEEELVSASFMPTVQTEGNTAPSNVINLPVRTEGEASSDAIALEIAKGIRYLSPEQLAWAVSWAAKDNATPLTDQHLEALSLVIAFIQDSRHPQVVDIAN
ncbi:ParB/RepB/Spo0J family partition protein [Nostoc sp.]|uniref:ParB/RepB/Spo0J family partition protein n=1 Tax=Nostoc sp. TaxID=1180 RepID=UPI002FFC92EA